MKPSLMLCSYFGHSNIVNFDGTVIAECDGTPDQVQFANLSLTAIRCVRGQADRHAVDCKLNG